MEKEEYDDWVDMLLEFIDMAYEEGRSWGRYEGRIEQINSD
jgi:hypothetical protein